MFNKIGYKAFVTPEYKSLESGEDTSVTEEIMKDTNETVEELFTGNSSTEASMVESPFDLQIGSTPKLGVKVDPYTGELVEDPLATPYYVKSLDEFLSDAKIAEYEMKLERFDDLLKLYKTSKKDLEREQSRIIDEIESGIGDAGYNKQLLTFIENSLIKINTAIAKLPKRREETKKTYEDEFLAFKKAAKPFANEFNKAKTASERSAIIQAHFMTADINLDGWIGEPEKGIRVGNEVTFKDGTKGMALYDYETDSYITKLALDGTPVTSRWYDPSKEWTVTEHGLTIAEDKAGFKEDLVLQVIGNSNNYKEAENHLEAKIDISIPDYIVVKAGKDGPEVNPSKTDGIHYIPAKFDTDENGRIYQKPPSDLEKFVQVKIDKVILRSEPVNEEVPSGPYFHIAEFRTADGVIATEFRLLGRKDFAIQGDGASNYGLVLNGDERTDSVVVDARDMVSTYHHAFSEHTKENQIENVYDVKVPAEGQTIYDETMNLFSDTYGSAGYEPKDSKSVTGLMAVGLTGYIEGSMHGNNLCLFADPTSKEKGSQQKTTDLGEINPLYENVFIGNGLDCSSNAVFSTGGGDLYASDLTLVWRNATDSDAISAITVKNSLGHTAGPQGTELPVNEITQENRRNILAPVFAVLKGSGDKLIDNDTEGIDKSQDDGAYAGQQAFGDDYYFTEGEGVYSIPKTNNEGLIGDLDADTEQTAEDVGGAIGENVMRDKGDKIEAALAKLVTGEEDPYIGLTIEDLGGDYYNATYKEMDSAFAELAEGLNFTKNQDNWLSEESEEDKDDETI